MPMNRTDHAACAYAAHAAYAAHTACTAHAAHFGPARTNQRPRGGAGLVLLGLLWLGACASAPDAAPTSPSVLGAVAADAQGRVPAPLAPYFAADRRDGPRNAVLNAMLAGQHALDLGQPELARRLLDQAYQRIEVIYADNATARAARSKFVPEANKDFKGEPHERAMVGYYLGLADLLTGDLDNARSAFQWGEFQDTLSVAEEYQGDMASLQFLAGWVQHCEGRSASAQETLALARGTRPALPQLQPRHRVLLIVEAGDAPRKTRRGSHGEALAYLDQSDAPAPTLGEVRLGEQALNLTLAEDLHWQATTLGGRQIDQILAGKASFKDSATGVAQAGGFTSLMGSHLMHSGALQGNQRTVDLGGAMALGGLLTSFISGALADATRTEADTRMWHSLPGALYFGLAELPAGAATPVQVHARVPGPQGQVSVAAAVRPIPGTPCHVARLSPLAPQRGAWRGDAADAWLTLNDAERVAATVASTAPGAAQDRGSVPPARPVNPAPVRPSF